MDRRKQSQPEEKRGSVTRAVPPAVQRARLALVPSQRAPLVQDDRETTARLPAPGVNANGPFPSRRAALMTARTSRTVMTLATCVPVALFATAATARGQEASVSIEAYEYRDFPINVLLPASPVPAPVPMQDGRWLLVYHLFISSWAYTPLTLKEFQVVDARSKSVVLRYDEHELSERGDNGSRFPAVPAGRSLTQGHERELQPGESAAIVVFASFDSYESIPAALEHRLIFADDPRILLRRESIQDADRNFVVSCAPVQVRREAPLVVGAPLRGGPWVCANGPGPGSAHMNFVIRDGQARLPQQFGFDFFKVDGDGDVMPQPAPDEITNEMFYCYLAEVIHVAGRRVTVIETDVATNVPRDDGAVLTPITRENVAGNLIGIRIDRGLYAFYAHLEPGSIQVTLGQKVKKGDVIAKLGNTGNATGPHLHFHICDSNNLNGSQGQPYVFEGFELEGKQSDSRPREAGAKRTVHTATLPADDCVVWFGGDK